MQRSIIMMEEKDRQILKSVLEKRRGCIELTRDEQKWVDQTFNKSFDKKFKNQVFIQKTGEEIRKEAGAKNKGPQPGGAIAEERSEFGAKGKIAGEDNSGAIKETEEGDMVSVDEKEGGEEEAAQTNASDITHADNKKDQRKPVLKLGDVVLKTINGKPYVGFIVKYYAQHGIAQVKWANGTFSNALVNDLEKVTGAYGEKKKDEPVEDPAESEDIETAAEPAGEAAESPEHEAAEAPEEEAAEHEAGAEEEVPVDEGAEAIAGAEGNVDANGEEDIEDAPKEEDVEVEKPAASAQSIAQAVKNVKVDITRGVLRAVEDELLHSDEEQNEWISMCMKSASCNPDVENPDSLCSLAHRKMKKSGDTVIRLTAEELKADNPKLAAAMEKSGCKTISIETTLRKDAAAE